MGVWVPILAVFALTELRAFEPRTIALAVPLLALGFLAGALFIRS